MARGGGVADRRKKKRRTVKERQGEKERETGGGGGGGGEGKKQGEANGRSKQVEAVERGRVSVSAVHLVHSCSLRRAAGSQVNGRRREIADGRTNEWTDGRAAGEREGVAAAERAGRRREREREKRTLQRGTPLWTDGRKPHSRP